MKKNIIHLTTEIVQKVIIVFFGLFVGLLDCFTILLGSQSRDRFYRQIPLSNYGWRGGLIIVRWTLGRAVMFYSHNTSIHPGAKKRPFHLASDRNFHNFLLITLISSAWLPHRNVLLERAVRSAFDAHTDPIFKSLKLLKFENIVSLQVAKIIYLYKNGQLPESFKNMFFTGQEIHNYDTRNRKFFRLPSCRTNVRKFAKTIRLCALDFYAR